MSNLTLKEQHELKATRTFLHNLFVLNYSLLTANGVIVSDESVNFEPLW